MLPGVCNTSRFYTECYRQRRIAKLPSWVSRKLRWKICENSRKQIHSKSGIKPGTTVSVSEHATSVPPPLSDSHQSNWPCGTGPCWSCRWRRTPGCRRWERPTWSTRWLPGEPFCSRSRPGLGSFPGSPARPIRSRSPQLRHLIKNVKLLRKVLPGSIHT